MSDDSNEIRIIVETDGESKRVFVSFICSATSYGFAVSRDTYNRMVDELVRGRRLIADTGKQS